MSTERLHHAESDLWVDPVSGLVYNRHGRAVGAGTSSPYLRVQKTGRHFYLHRIVYEVVNGPIPAGMQINHLSGDKRDNRIENLELVTQKENLRHAMRTGLSPRGERCPWARLTEAQVIEIRATKGSVGVGEWARRLGVCRSTVSLARSGRNWLIPNQQEAA